MGIEDYRIPLQIAEGFLPVDMSLGANDGDWVNIGGVYRHVDVVLFKAVGGAGEPATLTLEQATDAAGSGAKALTFTKIYSKQAASNLQAVGAYAEITQLPAATYSEASNGDKAALWIVSINYSQLDTVGGFKFVRGRVADVGTTAQRGALLYIFDTKERARGHLHTTAIA